MKNLIKHKYPNINILFYSLNTTLIIQIEIMTIRAGLNLLHMLTMSIEAHTQFNFKQSPKKFKRSTTK